MASAQHSVDVARPIEDVFDFLANELSGNATGGTTVRCTIDVRAAGAARIAAPVLALLRPLFAWEASWLDNARDVLQGASAPG